MAVYVYFQSTGTPDGTYTPSTGWDVASDYIERPASLTPTGTTMTTHQYRNSSNANASHLVAQFVVTEPLAAQTVSSSPRTLNMRCQEGHTNDNMYLAGIVYVVDSTFSTARSQALFSLIDGTEMSATTLESRQMTDTLGGTEVQDGDRLIVEVGIDGDPSGGRNHDADLSIGDDGSVRLGNEGDTDADNPYFFALGLLFLGGPTTQSAFMAGGVAASDNQSAYTEGESTGTPASDTADAFLDGQDTDLDTQTAFLVGSTETLENQDAYLLGSIDTSDTQSTYTAGQNTTADSSPSYTRGSADDLDSSPAYIIGQDTASASQSAFISTGTDALDSTNVYLAGQDTASANIPALVIGGINTTSGTPIYLDGQDIALNTESAFLAGGINVTDATSVYLHGRVIASDTQTVYTEGIPDIITEIDIQSGSGHLAFTDAAGAAARAIGLATDTSNVELLLKFTFDDISSGGIFRATIRASGDWNDWQTPTTAYEFAIANTGNWVINRISSGSRTQIGSDTWTASTSAYWVRFRADNYQISAKVWADGSGEPTWDVDYDDTTSGFTTAGTVQVGYFRVAGAHEMYIDDLLYSGLGRSSVPTYAAGGINSLDAQSVFLQAQETAQDTQPVYLIGSITDSSTSPAYLVGSVDDSDTQVAYLVGGIVESTSQPVYLNAQDTATSFQAAYIHVGVGALGSISAFLAASSTATDNAPAFTQGSIDDLDVISAYLAGLINDLATQATYLIGSIDTSDAQSAYLVVGLPDSSTAAVYLSGSEDASDAQAAYLASGDSALSTTSVYAAGHNTDLTDTPAYIAGHDTAADTTPAHLAGSIDNLATQVAYLIGSSDASDAQATYLAGNDTALSAVPVYTAGQDSDLATTPAYIAGYDTSSDTQSSYIAGQDTTQSSLNAFARADDYEELIPDGDITVGSWKNESEGSVLWSSIEEFPFQDSDYVYYDGAAGSESFEVSLSDPIGDPESDGTHTIIWRAGQIEGTSTIIMKVDLMQGAAVLATDQQTITASFQTFEYNLTQGEVDSITNYPNLRLRFTVVSVT